MNDLIAVKKLAEWQRLKALVLDSVSDVCTLRKDAISRDGDKGMWRVLLRTQKTGDPVYLPVPDTLKLALDALPLPRNAARDCPYYFWNEQTSRRAVVGIAERTLGTVFKKSGIKNAQRPPFSPHAGHAVT